MLSKVLPFDVATAEALDDPPEATLFPQEEEQIRDSVESRRREFTTVRWCARQAMAELGLPPAAVVSGRRGVPLWAPDVVGSMTHCAGFRGAALARQSRYASVGIDAEPNQRLPQGVLESIGLPPELVWVYDLLAAAPQVRWDRLLFSLKEAVYKTWYPLTRRELDFDEALITVDPVGRGFRARISPAPHLRRPGDPQEFHGRWVLENGVLLSAIALSARGPAQRGRILPLGRSSLLYSTT